MHDIEDQLSIPSGGDTAATCFNTWTADPLFEKIRQHVNSCKRVTAGPLLEAIRYQRLAVERAHLFQDVPRNINTRKLTLYWRIYGNVLAWTFTVRLTG